MKIDLTDASREKQLPYDCIVKLEMLTSSQNYNNPPQINPLYYIQISLVSFGTLHFETTLNYPVFSSKVKNLFFK